MLAPTPQGKGFRMFEKTPYDRAVELDSRTLAWVIGQVEGGANLQTIAGTLKRHCDERAEIISDYLPSSAAFWRDEASKLDAIAKGVEA